MVIIGDPSTVTIYGTRCFCARYKVGAYENRREDYLLLQGRLQEGN